MNGGRESHSACFQAFILEGALNPNLAPFAFCFPVSPLCCGIGGLHKKNLVLGWLRTVFYFDAIIRNIFRICKKKHERKRKKILPLCIS